MCLFLIRYIGNLVLVVIGNDIIMPIIQIRENKKRLLDLLLLADEQESMIDRYLGRGEMFALYEDSPLVAACVVTDEGAGLCELKNVAVYPQFQRKGYGRQLIGFLLEHYKDTYRAMQVGTGESPETITFYEHCGFVYSHRIPGFFTGNYDHPIYEGGKLLVDMVYFKRAIDR